MSTLEPFALPGDVSDSRRYWPRDIVVPAPRVEADGSMRLVEDAGIGASIDCEYLDAVSVMRRSFP
jgi:O-succinylbenzoate synthase